MPRYKFGIRGVSQKTSVLREKLAWYHLVKHTYIIHDWGGKKRCIFYSWAEVYGIIDEKRGNMLDIFVTSRVRRKIIVVFAKYPDFKTHVRGLAKLIKEDPGNIQRELTRMTEGNFLIMTKKGNTRIYQTNKQFPILKELQSIVIKTQKGSKPNKTIG